MEKRVAYRSMLVIAIIVFVVEMINMLILGQLTHLSGIEMAIVDSILLVVTLTPILYHAILVPFERGHQLLLEERAKSEFASKMASLGEMTSGIVHEINNFISTILLNSRKIRRSLPEDLQSEITKPLDVIDRTINQIMEVTRSMRKFSRGGADDPFEAIDLPAMISEVLVMCHERSMSSGVDVIVNKDGYDDSCILYGRYVELSQVLINLINNAFDALRETSQTIKKILIEVKSRDGDKVEVQVCDNGPGIPKDLQAKIFQPFFTTKPIGLGTGLGLSITRKIVESHKGAIHVESGPEGTCFCVTLPHNRPIQAVEATG